MINIEVIVIGIIGIVISLVVATSLAPTVIDQTRSNAFNSTGTDNPAGQLENASGTSKTMYSLVEVLYAIMIVIFMVSVGFGLGRRATA